MAWCKSWWSWLFHNVLSFLLFLGVCVFWTFYKTNQNISQFEKTTCGLAIMFLAHVYYKFLVWLFFSMIWQYFLAVSCYVSEKLDTAKAATHSRECPTPCWVLRRRLTALSLVTSVSQNLFSTHPAGVSILLFQTFCPQSYPTGCCPGRASLVTNWWYL